MSEDRKWPLAGYAPGGYTCHCAKCGVEFTGDKRAYNCLPCAETISRDRIKAQILASPDLDTEAGFTRATTPTASELVEALRGTFCVLFLDGRNEHGSHVLPSFPTSIDLDEVDLAEQAESILREAESLGFVVGEDHVWAEFTWVEPQIGDEGRIELDGYYDFKRINVVMTRAALSNIREA